jgi:hypothetical protein
MRGESVARIRMRVPASWKMRRDTGLRIDAGEADRKLGGDTRQPTLPPHPFD